MLVKYFLLISKAYQKLYIWENLLAYSELQKFSI